MIHSKPTLLKFKLISTKQPPTDPQQIPVNLKLQHTVLKIKQSVAEHFGVSPLQAAKIRMVRGKTVLGDDQLTEELGFEEGELIRVVIENEGGRKEEVAGGGVRKEEVEVEKKEEKIQYPPGFFLPVCDPLISEMKSIDNGAISDLFSTHPILRQLASSHPIFQHCSTNPDLLKSLLTPEHVSTALHQMSKPDFDLSSYIQSTLQPQPVDPTTYNPEASNKIYNDVQNLTPERLEHLVKTSPKIQELMRNDPQARVIFQNPGLLKSLWSKEVADRVAGTLTKEEERVVMKEGVVGGQVGGQVDYREMYKEGLEFLRGIGQEDEELNLEVLVQVGGDIDKATDWLCGE